MSINGIEDFEQSFSRPVTLHECASDMLAGGIAHDLWNTDPFPVYFERAGELYKCNFQGNQLVQFWLGPEAHLCGHRFELDGDIRIGVDHDSKEFDFEGIQDNRHET